jgi:ABC-type sugar transport system permease subunit
MYQKSRRSLVIPFLLPAFLLYTILRFIPVVQTIWSSLTNWQGAGREAPFYGLRNYQLMFMDPQFLNAAKNTAAFAIYGVIILLIPALFLSWALTQNIKFKGIFRFVIISPHLLSVVAVALLWKLLYDPGFGPINNLLKLVGLKSWALPWLGDSNTALVAVVIAAAWAQMGMWVLLISAGLERIPPELLEAARIDGANEWQVFWGVTIPLVWGILRTLIILWIILSLQVFAWVYIMSGTSSGSVLTEVIATLLYNRAFSSYQWGLACAMATFLLIVIFVLSAVTNWLTKREVIEY